MDEFLKTTERAEKIVADFHGVEFSHLHARQIRKVARLMSFLPNEKFEICDSGTNKQWGGSIARDKKYKFCFRIGGTHAYGKDKKLAYGKYLWLCVFLGEK